MLSGTTLGDGTVTLQVEAGRFLRYDGCVGVVVDGTTPCTAQVTSEPAIGSDLRANGGSIKIQVYRSNVITSVLLTVGAQGLVPAGAGIVVRVLVWGV
jgi:hypothetical protein